MLRKRVRIIYKLEMIDGAQDVAMKKQFLVTLIFNHLLNGSSVPESCPISWIV